MGASTSKPSYGATPPSMGIKRPGLDTTSQPTVSRPEQEVRPGAQRPGIKFGPGQSTRFD